MIDLLRKYTPKFMSWYRVPRQVQSVLSKILLCRTPVLNDRVYECRQCGSRCHVYNSCTDRHCPQCMGARRADWLHKTQQLLLDGVTYFQVVFTLPDRLSSLILGNRRVLYDLLFRSAWQALDEIVRQRGKYHPAALMVLHTWNQELDHHPHIHALVPGGGPALDGTGWINSKHPTQRNRVKPFLVDNVLLGRAFRKKFVEGFRRLVGGGKLHLEDRWSRLKQPRELKAWIDELTESDWNVFIEGPPDGKSNPATVLKYLARYMTGGPISDRRLIRDEDGDVTFRARSKNKAQGNRSRPFTLSGKEFVRRWSMHILPKGYTRSRCYGGYHGRKRKEHLQCCRRLLAAINNRAQQRSYTVPAATDGSAPEVNETLSLVCPDCKVTMDCIQRWPRPSWREVFKRGIYSDPSIYSPMLHSRYTGASPFPYEPDS